MATIMDASILRYILSLGLIQSPPSGSRPPRLHRLRSSDGFITFTIALGITTDLLSYSIIVPVIPFRLQAEGYDHDKISSLTSYLLVAYSVGLVGSTLPSAYIFHKYPYRRGPLLIGLQVLILSLILFMLARPYWCMVIGRILQGLSSGVIWTVGLALIAENVKAGTIGRQVGWASSGVGIGLTLGPVLGGVLYDKLGWNAPFLVCIGSCVLDYVARLMILEKSEVRRWVAQPEAEFQKTEPKGEEKLDEDQAVVYGLGRIPAPTQDDEVVVIGFRSAHTSLASTLPPPSALQSFPRGSIIYPSYTEPSLDHSPLPSPTLLGPDLESPLDSTYAPYNSDVCLIKETKRDLTVLQVLAILAKDPRAVVAFIVVGLNAFIIGCMEPALTLRIHDVWHKDSTFVGLVYLAAAIPTFFTGPLAGWLGDKWGVEIVVPLILLIGLPFPAILVFKGSLPGFVIVVAIINSVVTAVSPPMTLEVANISHKYEGIGEIHQFGAINLSWGIFSCIGPLIGGQVYDRVKDGWNVLCWFFMALILAIIPLVLFISGDRPLAKRLITKLRKPAGGSRTQTVSPAAGADAKQTGEPKNDGPDRLAEPAVKA